jgi:hypothetical protein
MAAGTFYFVLYGLRLLFFRYGRADCHYLFCFQFGFHGEGNLAVAFKIWNT